MLVSDVCVLVHCSFKELPRLFIFFIFLILVGGYFLHMMLVFKTSWHFWPVAQEHQKWWQRVKLEISRCGTG